MSSSLRQWMQSNQVFDKDLLRLFPKYGVNNPDEDLCNLSEDKWAEMENVLMNEKRAELKDNATLLRFKKKLSKIQKIYQKHRKNNIHKQKKASKKIISINRRNSKTSTSPYSINSDANDEILQLRMENKRLRRELSSKNSDYNRLLQDFQTYKVKKEEEIKKLNQKCLMKSDEYEKLLKNYKQINQRINSKYHDNSAKDKEISNLRTDKSTLLSDINVLMKCEQEKYDILLDKYKDLKAMNNRNLKYKLRYKKEQNRKKKATHNYNYTVALNATDISKITEIDNEYEHSDNDINEHKENGFHEYYRPKKFKPSKEKRARARQLSEILSPEKAKHVYT